MDSLILKICYFKYLDKLKDDSIKIMDANGNILNIESSNVQVQNISLILEKYALDTSFMENELYNYLDEINVTTAFNLASKYLYFSIYVPKEVREEIIALAKIYFNESEQFLNESDINNKFGFSQRLNLIIIEHLIYLPQRSMIGLCLIISFNLVVFHYCDFLDYLYTNQ